MQRYTLCVLLVFCVCTAGAQPLAAAFKNAARTLPGKTVSAEALGRRAAQLLAERSAPEAFAAARKQCLQLVATEDKQIYCPADVPPAFSLRNKLLTQARRELLEKNWQLFYSARKRRKRYILPILIMPTSFLLPPGLFSWGRYTAKIPFIKKSIM